MRRGPSCLAALAFAVFAVCDVASAAPQVAFKAGFVPIAGAPRTGNYLGAGAAIQTEYGISGTEYGGFPQPLIGLNLYLPQGVVLRPGAAPSCEKAVLEETGPSGCPAGSLGGPIESFLGVVEVGSEREQESGTVEPFTAPGGGISFYIAGQSPASLHAIASGHYVHLEGHEGYGPELISEVPLISTVEGAPFASLESLHTTFGPSYQTPEGPAYYLTLPQTCHPETGMPIKSELIFDEGGAKPPVPVVVTSTYKAPCPQPLPTEPPSASSPNALPTPSNTTAPHETPASNAIALVSAPPNKRCISHHQLRIRLRRIRGRSYRQIRVYVNHRRGKVINRPRPGATIELTHLPRGRFTVKIVAITTKGRKISWKRTYHGCASKTR